MITIWRCFICLKERKTASLPLILYWSKLANTLKTSPPWIYLSDYMLFSLFTSSSTDFFTTTNYSHILPLSNNSWCCRSVFQIDNKYCHALPIDLSFLNLVYILYVFVSQCVSIHVNMFVKPYAVESAHFKWFEMFVLWLPPYTKHRVNVQIDIR